MTAWAPALRRIVLDESRRAGVGHIGSALSVVELVAAIYRDVLRGDGPRDPDRDRFVLSKGHAALALYGALHLRGWLDREGLASYCADGSVLGVHPDHALPGVDFSTGSLGHGLGLGAGAALAARMQRSTRRVYVLISDAECNAGSTWEAAMFAAHHRLSNLTVLLDANGQQALGATEEILSLEPLAERWRAFGWDVHELDGHDEPALADTLRSLPDVGGPPHVLVARTVFGKGVTFMEGRLDWHYLPMSEGEYRAACAEIGGAP